MPDLKDYIRLTDRQAEREKTEHVHKLRSIIPQLTEITEKARTVTEHPGWQYFLDALETKIVAVDAKKATHVKAMLFGPALGQDLERLKIELNAMDAEINALRYAQTLIPDVLEHGRESLRVAAERVAT